MAEAPAPRQVLYAMVAAAFHVVVGILAWASAGLAPDLWNVTVAVLWAALALVITLGWRRTGLVLGVSIGGFLAWTVGAAVLFT